MSKLFASIYDWVNTCEISQLDAILVALFVLVVGCGLIATLFVTAIFERDSSIQPLPQRVISHVQMERAAQSGQFDASIVTSPPSADHPHFSNFGRPRQTAGLPGVYASGPASAAGSYSY